MTTSAPTASPSGTVDPAAAPPAAAGFDLDAAWRLDDRVSIRPEPFGALLYHFGTRRLTFLKSPLLLEVVRGLADHPTARAACVAAGVAEAQVPQYTGALASLVHGDMIVRRAAEPVPAASTAAASTPARQAPSDGPGDAP